MRPTALDALYARVRDGLVESYLTDALGSVLKLRDAAQTRTVSYTYDPYGGTHASGTSSNTVKYTGREEDLGDLYYYRHRYYKPSIGRFLSEDPIGLAGGENFYAYVENNPINWVDPLGFVNTDPTGPFGPFGPGGGGVGAGGTWGGGPSIYPVSCVKRKPIPSGCRS